MLLQTVAKVLSRHMASHATRVEATMEKVRSQNRSISHDVQKMGLHAHTKGVETSAMAGQWVQQAKDYVKSMRRAHEEDGRKLTEVIFQESHVLSYHCSSTSRDGMIPVYPSRATCVCERV